MQQPTSHNEFVFKKGTYSIIVNITQNNIKNPILEEHQKGQLAAYRVVSS